MKPIAYIHTDFKEKFGIPRQSGRVPSLTGRIVFLPEYRNPDALRGIESFSHLWLLFDFSRAHRKEWSPTVRPPRLGGNKKIGVFASRSPFRPNPIGLSSVRFAGIEKTKFEGDVLVVAGADLLDGTPIYDIKPYLPHADCHPEATGGFSADRVNYSLRVDFPQALMERIDEDQRDVVKQLLSQDPRPSYQSDPARVYGMRYGRWNVKFVVDGGVLTVTEIE